MLTPEQLIVAAILTCLGGAVLTLVCARGKTLAGMLAFGVTVALLLRIMMITLNGCAYIVITAS